MPPEDFISPYIDIIVRSKGSFVFKEIIDRFEKGEELDGIPGTAFAKAGKLVRTDYTPAVDLDASPFTDRRLTAKYRKNYALSYMKPLALIRTSSGFPGNRSFCGIWKMAGGRYLTRKPEKVVEELAGINEKHIGFADNDSFVDAMRMKILANMIKEAGIQKRYFINSRRDTNTRNPELIEIWKDIGLYHAGVDIEG